MVKVQTVYGALIALCGLAFWFWARLWPDAMSPATYGYAAYDTEAEIWAMAYLGAGSLVVAGAAVDPLWRAAALARGAAFLLLLIMSYVLAVSAWDAPNGAPIVIFSALFFGPVAALFLALNVAAYLGRPDGAA
jgi:hypothetical protein